MKMSLECVGLSRKKEEGKSMNDINGGEVKT